MPPRLLTPFERPYADQLVAEGTKNTYEYACFIETATGPVLELVTDGKDDQANPTQITQDFIDNGGRPILHHNHLSQESLSFADWRGASEKFDEVFAHCADGTVYWGRVLDQAKMADILSRANDVEVEAMTGLFKLLATADGRGADELSSFFRKEVVNRAMVLAGVVDYAYAWSADASMPYRRATESAAIGPAGQLGKILNGFIDQAAEQLAPRL